MKKKTLFLSFTIAALIFTSCGVANPSYDEEVAFKQTPIFFGSTKVQDEPCTSFTLYALTTSAEYFYMLPEKHEFKFDDLLSNDNTPLDVNIYLVTQIRRGRTPALLANYGANWYTNFVEPYFRNKVREYVSSYSPFDLMSNRDILNQVNAKLTRDMNNYIVELSQKQEFPIEIKQVIIDRIMPNKEQLAEMNKTAAAIQAKQTQEKRVDMEFAREKAERQRAIADKAYMSEMNLSPTQYIQLRAWDVIEKKQGANIDVLVGGGEQPIWNIKR